MSEFSTFMDGEDCPDCEQCERTIAELQAEVERLASYADKLAAGLPDGMLPKDVEVLRDANAALVAECERLRGERDAAIVAAISKTGERP